MQANISALHEQSEKNNTVQWGSSYRTADNKLTCAEEGALVGKERTSLISQGVVGRGCGRCGLWEGV